VLLLIPSCDECRGRKSRVKTIEQQIHMIPRAASPERIYTVYAVTKWQPMNETRAGAGAERTNHLYTLTLGFSTHCSRFSPQMTWYTRIALLYPGVVHSGGSAIHAWTDRNKVSQAKRYCNIVLVFNNTDRKETHGWLYLCLSLFTKHVLSICILYIHLPLEPGE
jgi:hypothetical protein